MADFCIKKTGMVVHAGFVVFAYTPKSTQIRI